MRSGNEAISVLKLKRVFLFLLIFPVLNIVLYYNQFCCLHLTKNLQRSKHCKNSEIVLFHSVIHISCECKVVYVL
jgi:hypothetical protein